MFRLAAPCALFAGALLFAGPALAQQRLPTIAPEQYTAEQKKRPKFWLLQSSGVWPVRADDVQPGSYEHRSRDG